MDLKNKPAWYWERNPNGTVPILEQNGHVIYESTATCEWLDDVFPHCRLTPGDPYVTAKDRMLLEYFSKVTLILVLS